MSVVGLPALLAPIIGGVMADDLPWQWIFVINVPVGIASVVLSVRMLPPVRCRCSSASACRAFCCC